MAELFAKGADPTNGIQPQDEERDRTNSRQGKLHKISDDDPAKAPQSRVETGQANQEDNQ